MQPFPYPNDASYKIWLQSASRSQETFMFESMDRRTPARVLSYKLTLWAFGSGELKKTNEWFHLLMQQKTYKGTMTIFSNLESP